MFNRFTQSARESVQAANALARERQEPYIDVAHLLIGTGIADPRIGAVLDTFGCNRSAVISFLDHGFDKILLDSIGVHLDEVGTIVDASFVNGLAEASTQAGPWYQRSSIERSRFSKAAKACLEHALRIAVEEKSGEIAARHVALAALERSQQLHAVLVSQGVDVELCVQQLVALSAPSSAA